MRLFEGAEALELTMQSFAGPSVIHPVLLWGEDGATIVDTGFPGMGPALGEAFSRFGQSVERLTRVILTHQDIDHIGNLPLLAGHGTQVLAHTDDIPYIEGDLPLLKMTPERQRQMLEQLPSERRRQAEALFANLPTAKVTQALHDGEELPIHGGIRVIHTPGHTPGHVSLYFPAHRLLLSGDALRVVDGELVGPWPQVTPNMPQAMESLRKLPDDVDYILCYHGGLYGPNAYERLEEVVAGN